MVSSLTIYSTNLVSIVSILRSIIPENILKGTVAKNATAPHWIFTTKTGSQVRQQGTWSAFKLACQRARIDNATLHTLRHTFASHLIMAGVDLATVSKLLGHKDISTTMIYSHLSPDHLKQAVEKLQL